jgi:hypothetical protein
VSHPATRLLPALAASFVQTGTQSRDLTSCRVAMERFGARGLLQSARCLAQLFGRPRVAARDRFGSNFYDVSNV